MKLFNNLFNKKKLTFEQPFFFKCKDFPYVARNTNEFICSCCGKEFLTSEDHLSYCPYCGCKNKQFANMNEKKMNENQSYRTVLSEDVPDVILYIDTKTFNIYIYGLQKLSTKEARKWIDRFKEDYLNQDYLNQFTKEK